MNLNLVLSQLGITSYASCTEIKGGNDSTVFKIVVQEGAAYALRLLPAERFQQLIHEKNMIDLAFDHHVQVPNVLSVSVYGEYSAMLMEWVTGQTVLSEICQRPDNASKIGYEFGRVQASINSISVPATMKNIYSTWLTPTTNEQVIVDKLSNISEKNHLLHLDFHPLNVLTDGKKITGVIDWANASIGDFRFDLSRTLSILQLEGPKLFGKNSSVLTDFEKGWKEGYESVLGKAEGLPIFCEWAGWRMKRDLDSRLKQEDYQRIEEWIDKWQ